ncbi:hypothetical protein RZS08_36905, partial [Arthrospira platensis SPKY1]|nr:hypothetical protein [Arthrospira platensis SPKY1]
GLSGVSDRPEAVDRSALGGPVAGRWAGANAALTLSLTAASWRCKEDGALASAKCQADRCRGSRRLAEGNLTRGCWFPLAANPALVWHCDCCVSPEV